jgi:hypothetical protein
LEETRVFGTCNYTLPQIDIEKDWADITELKAVAVPEESLYKCDPQVRILLFGAYIPVYLSVRIPFFVGSGAQDFESGFGLGVVLKVE